MSSKSKDKGDCFFCKCKRNWCTHKSNKLYAERLAWFLGKDFSDSEAANQARNELLALSKLDPKIYMTTSPVTRALLKSAEQTIEDDEPVSVGHGAAVAHMKTYFEGAPHITPEVQKEVSKVIENAQGGKKYDSGKPRFGLLPQRALSEVAKVMTYGAAKYGDDNWREVEAYRYLDALGRHLAQASGVSLGGEEASDVDPESGLLHLAHVACNALFLLEKKLEELDEDAADLELARDLLELKRMK